MGVLGYVGLALFVTIMALVVLGLCKSAADADDRDGTRDE